MSRFTRDNTEGYTAAALAILNAQYETALASFPPDARTDKSLQDHVAERVLATYDTETASRG